MCVAGGDGTHTATAVKRLVEDRQLDG